MVESGDVESEGCGGNADGGVGSIEEGGGEEGENWGG